MLRSHRPGRRSVLVGVLACALFVAGGAAVYAAVGGSGVAKLCYDSKQGTTRVVDDAAQCTSREAALSVYTKAGADAAFLGKTAKAADSDQLDGKDSSAFVKILKQGTSYPQAWSLDPGACQSFGMAYPDEGTSFAGAVGVVNLNVPFNSPL